MRSLVPFLCAFLVACGSDSGGGPPKSPSLGGNGGTGSGGSSGTGASSTGGHGGSAGGTAGATSKECVSSELGDLWERVNGSYTMQATSIGSSAETEFTSGDSYQVEISRSSCSLIFHGASEIYTCVWNTPGMESKLLEEPAAGGWLIRIGDVVPFQSSLPSCQVDGFLDPDRVSGGRLFLPYAEYESTFALTAP